MSCCDVKSGASWKATHALSFIFPSYSMLNKLINYFDHALLFI